MKLSASSSRLRGALLLAPVFCAVLLLGYGLLLSGTSASRTLPASQTISLNPQPYHHALGYRFSEEDVLAYEKIFTLQNGGHWKAADKTIATLDDKTLLGAILSQRYLHEDYTSSYDELAQWLDAYADMPQAPRILALARQKKPADATLPELSLSARTLKGAGVRDGIHGETLPAHWKAGLAAWSHHRYGDAAKIFSSVAQRKDLTGWHRSAGHYWAWRAYSRAGDNRKASTHLQRAAEYPLTLYGVLAAKQLGQANHLSSDLPKVDAVTLAIPAVRRAALYSALNRREDADEELRSLYPKLTQSQRKQLVTVAAELDLPALQLRIAQADRKQPKMSAASAYPIPRWIPHYDMMADPALVFAIARQESAFSENARNPHSGATGVMQVMPSTASYMIRQYRLDEIKVASLDFTGLGTKAITVGELHDPRVNLTVAQHYINYLLEKPFIEGNLIHMLAAYNAGPANLISWQKRFEDIEDPLFFIETIPFRETRQYVKQVMTNYLIYDQLMNGDGTKTAALARNQWPTVSLPGQRVGSASELASNR